ncbi:unnamed protein product [Angiostrongylus costaricensis]|uniref:phosphoserine transaminase n=1 Tax=Angiostrongylus costaricensis TaxID=334426 RepID=A0A0R3PPW8_ANGCS|nr:unnamed protein product [Angiostrongylus costaricensis]
MSLIAASFLASRIAHGSVMNIPIFHLSNIHSLEISHRSKEFAELLQETKQLLRELMSVPDEFEILFMQGGGTGQFAAVPMNLKGDHEFADYMVTGAWSNKAAEEGSKYLRVKKVFTPSKPYVTIPDESQWDHDKDAAFLYYCANETVHGIEFPSAPKPAHGVPLVADISSNFLSRPFDFSNHGVVFGGTQKNLGTAGVTVVMHQPTTPAILCYKEMSDNNSLYNTPTVFGYAVFFGHLDIDLFFSQRNKAGMLYDIIDNSNSFYKCAVNRKYRSNMNVCFRIKDSDEQLEAEFLKGATDRGMLSLKGHRSVGGIRASLYNAVTLEETACLASWMREFMASHAE